MNCAAIIAAAGSGSRAHLDIPKQLLPLGGKPLFLWSLRIFEKLERVREVFLVVPEGKNGEFQKAIAENSPVKLVAGGDRRQDSVLAGLNQVSRDVDIVLVHDAARPFINAALVNALIDTAVQQGAAIPIAPVSETLKEVSHGRVIQTLDRGSIYRAQTPQVFQKEILLNVFRSVPQERVWTDEASMLESAGIPVAAVPGDERNIKITYLEDFHYAEYLLSRE
ncbi:MAG TPA: 2-C-methyl-D-erythritol 4-phosphate cytidylyltransferase [Acidobacteriota bacterium]|jgi:2-C-methyl-D-erythritol 4-phosphate cytidylyltransferase/2-C-methyl-D-erythritol 2,4-cyclodiphosphate synthase|nr:2-C-methyl-D-erythritol 4-phosphate cytidylyltransferase [Acidobacteriota bacterium]